MTAQGISRDPVLSNDWHVLARSGDLVPGTLRRARRLGEDRVRWRDDAGQAHAGQDLCIHRGARLSLGKSYDHEKPEAQIVELQDFVIARDVNIVESQHPERLPRDSQAELHLRSDRVAIAYRRWINALGLVFGTA